MDDVGAVLVAGVIGAAVALWGVFSQRAISRRRATLDLISRSEADKDMLAARQRFIELAKADGGLAPFAEEAREKDPDTYKIRLVLNEFELISIGIQRGVVDYELYALWFRSGTVKYWSHARPFVIRLRERTSNDMFYHEFEELARWLGGARKPRRYWWWGKIR